MAKHDESELAARYVHLGREILAMEGAPLLACPDCGSPEVEEEGWIDANREGDYARPESPGYGYCRACDESHHRLTYVPDLVERYGEAPTWVAFGVGVHAERWMELIVRARWAREYRP